MIGIGVFSGAFAVFAGVLPIFVPALRLRLGAMVRLGVGAGVILASALVIMVSLSRLAGDPVVPYYTMQLSFLVDVPVAAGQVALFLAGLVVIAGLGSVRVGLGMSLGSIAVIMAPYWWSGYANGRLASELQDLSYWSTDQLASDARVVIVNPVNPDLCRNLCAWLARRDFQVFGASLTAEDLSDPAFDWSGRTGFAYRRQAGNVTASEDEADLPDTFDLVLFQDPVRPYGPMLSDTIPQDIDINAATPDLTAAIYMYERNSEGRVWPEGGPSIPAGRLLWSTRVTERPFSMRFSRVPEETDHALVPARNAYRERLINWLEGRGGVGLDVRGYHNPFM